MPIPQSLLLVLDVQGVVDSNELKAQLEHEPREVFRLSEFGAPTYSRESPAPWPTYGVAIEKLAARVKEVEREAGRSLALFVGGRAPLPLFVHLGFALQRFGGPQTVIHFDQGTWKLFPLTAHEGGGTPFFTRLAGLEASKRSSGRVAVFVDARGRDPAVDAFRDVIEDMGDRLADVVEIGSSQDVTPENAARLAAELVREIPRIPSVYQYSAGPAIFTTGPTVVAFAVGLALTASVFANVWLTNGAPPDYEFVYELPFVTARGPRPLPNDESDRAARSVVRDSLIASIDSLRAELQQDDLFVADPAVAARLVERLRTLSYDDTDSDEFKLSISEQKLAFGGHLLDGLRPASAEMIKTFARLLVLHELWHVDQDILSSNFQEIGRAGVVLERLDYNADIFAVRSLFDLSTRISATNSTEDLRARLAGLLEAVLFGVEAFDRAVDPTRIDPLPERRLRRYLIWHAQIARARTIRNTDDAHALLETDLAIELAPLRGQLDERFDKIVTKATPETELFVAVNGRLARQQRRPGLEPGPIVDAVRSFNRLFVEDIMTKLVDSHRGVLAPWVV